jgi:hypothetical protein
MGRWARAGQSPGLTTKQLQQCRAFGKEPPDVPGRVTAECDGRAFGAGGLFVKKLTKDAA